MRTVRQIRRPNGLGISLSVSHAPSCIVTTTPSRTDLNLLNLNVINWDKGSIPIWCKTMSYLIMIYFPHQHWWIWNVEMRFAITGSPLRFKVCSTDGSGGQQRKDPHYWPFVWILWSPMDSPHKGTIMRKAFPCHDVILDIQPLACCQESRYSGSPLKSIPLPYQ